MKRVLIFKEHEGETLAIVNSNLVATFKDFEITWKNFQLLTNDEVKAIKDKAFRK